MNNNTNIIMQYVHTRTHISGRVVANSFFSDPARRKRQTAPDNDFIPVFFHELDITDEHRKLCGDNPPCLFDLAASGSKELALATVDHQKATNETIDILSKC